MGTGALARRGTTIKLSDEYPNLGIPMRTCEFKIDNDTGRTSQKIWPNLDEGHTMSLLKLQSVIVGVIMGYCNMAAHERRIGLARLFA